MFDVEHGVEFGLAPGPRAVGLTVATGRLRALAVTSATRSEALPDVPTIGDFLPGYEVTTWFGIGAPSKPPVEIIMKLNNEARRPDGPPPPGARG
jgi:tripartite-type tricarboxylate transporter receptor subunit TctC